MCPVAYGKDGIRQRDYRVYGILANNAEYQTALSLIQWLYNCLAEESFSDAFTAWNEDGGLKTDYLTHLGEMRRDSINLSIDDGDSVEGNEVGKLVLSKNCKFEAELINATPENINELLAWDGKQGIIILEEITHNRLSNYEDAMLLARELVIIGNVPEIVAGLTDSVAGVISISEKHVGSGIAICNIGIERECGVPKNFRTVVELYEEDLMDAPVQSDTFVTASTYAVSWDSWIYAMIELATDAAFSNIIAVAETNVEEMKYQFDRLPAGTTYYSRLRSCDNNYIPKSKYSNVKSETTG